MGVEGILQVVVVRWGRLGFMPSLLWHHPACCVSPGGCERMGRAGVLVLSPSIPPCCVACHVPVPHLYAAFPASWQAVVNWPLLHVQHLQSVCLACHYVNRWGGCRRGAISEGIQQLYSGVLAPATLFVTLLSAGQNVQVWGVLGEKLGAGECQHLLDCCMARIGLHSCDVCNVNTHPCLARSCSGRGVLLARLPSPLLCVEQNCLLICALLMLCRSRKCVHDVFALLEDSPHVVPGENAVWGCNRPSLNDSACKCVTSA